MVFLTKYFEKLLLKLLVTILPILLSVTDEVGWDSVLMVDLPSQRDT